MNPAPIPPEPASKQRTIARLLKEARAAFSAHGLQGARVDDIARAAGVTKQLVYQYFESKEQLFACVLDASAEHNLAALLALELDALPPREALRAALHHAFKLYGDDPGLGPLVQQGLHYQDAHAAESRKFSAMAAALVAKLEAIVQRGMASGDFRAGIDARMCLAAAALLTTGAVTNRFMVLAMAGVDTREPRGLAAWRDHAVDFVFAAIGKGPPPSLARPAVLACVPGPAPAA